MFCTFWLQELLFATAAPNFFDIWTSKSAPELTCFVHFCFKMYVSPQRRAFFRHLNFKKCSRTLSFLTFSLANARFATAACIFSTSELQKVLRSWRALYIFTSKCAFRHSGMQFLISPLSSYLRTRRFNRPTFGLTRHTNHWKNTAFRDFSNIWRGCIFFLLTFALLHLLSTDLTTLLCFSTVDIVGSFYLNFLRQLDTQNESKVKGLLLKSTSNLQSIIMYKYSIAIFGKNIHSSNFTLRVIQSALFGMVKWPFQRLSDLQLGIQKVTAWITWLLYPHCGFPNPHPHAVTHLHGARQSDGRLPATPPF